MSLYGTLLFVHVAAALALWAALVVEHLAFGSLRAGPTESDLGRGLATVRSTLRWAMAAMLTLLVSGAALMKLSWGPVPWLLVSLGLLATLPLVGGVTLRRVREAVRATRRERDPARVVAALERLTAPALRVSVRLRAIAVLGIVFLMTAKPALGTALLTAGVVAAFATLVVAATDAGVATVQRERAAPRGR